MTGSFSTARKTPNRSDVILEKTFTRGKYIKNVKKSIKQIPEEDEGRHLPIVRNIKKREDLLLKGQSDEMNATFNQDRSSVYKKAYDSLSGGNSIKSSSPSPIRKETESSPTSQKGSLQFRTPILDHALR